MGGKLKMEDLRGTTFNALAAGSSTDTVSVFTRTWTVTDSVPTAGCKRIKVTASWTNKQGGQSTTLTSYVTR